ncbi:MAG: GntR family transcriptional regulator, partial [Anaerolineae bacterium]|nr:GntR family transcriptional regulator [Anaerolineae bacterium]
PARAHTAEWIAAELRREIVRGALKSGQPLPQDELAARFGVSKIPAREALFQLRAEGLVSFSPNRGAVVASLSADEVEEIYAMRIALETLALQRALPRLARADFVRLEGLITIMDDEQDPLRWSELNWEFHRLLYAPCKLPRLLDTIQSLHVNVQRYVVAYLSSVNYHAEAQQQHRAILHACQQGDAERATALLAAHLQQASDKMRDLLAPHPRGGDQP